jgi:hypothetical protein
MEGKMPDIKETDWKFLRALHQVALERLCQRILSEANSINARRDKGYHEKYLEIFEVLRQRDKELARAFDGMRRSNAIREIATLRSMDLLTDDEFLGFGGETRDLVNEMPGSRP